jgi:C_GCAxxG_C_C family probable redox protein
MNRKDIANNAVAKFLSGYNCAESVLLTMSTHAGIINPLIPKNATPFGGGIARSGSICGCVTGALMYIGTMYGRTKLTDDRKKAYTLASNLMDAFERKFGSLICHELTCCDFRTLEGKARWEQIKESKCVNLMKSTIERLLELEKQTFDS